MIRSAGQLSKKIPLHLWWARRPMAAARAVIFAQMVNDPGYERYLGRGTSKEKAKKERERLFGIIERLVKWENTSNSDVLEEAREEIRKSWLETCALNQSHPRASELFNPDQVPAFHDPFAGGGTIPLEAQRLGLDAYASDLNPVAVTINKAMIEIPLAFSGTIPVGPVPEGEKENKLLTDWKGTKGLAEDIRRYAAWMREEAFQKIGNFYPLVDITKDMAKERPDLKDLVGQKLTVVAWIWARTVKSPNPAFSDIDVPLVSTFLLASTKLQNAYVQPCVQGHNYSFLVKLGTPPIQANGGTTAGKRAAFICLMSGTPIDYDYIRSEGKAGRIGSRLMAVVVEGPKGRVYLSPLEEHAKIAKCTLPEWIPEINLPNNPRDFKTPNYGLDKFSDLFTSRQLVSLSTFSGLVQEAIKRCHRDAIVSGMFDDGIGLEQNGKGATAYSQAIGVYLGFGVDKLADRHSSLCRWDPTPTASGIINTFSRQALPMTWDFAEANPFSESSGNFESGMGWITKVIKTSLGEGSSGTAIVANASDQFLSSGKVVCTDPPYYDNIGYADLSDFFYIWLRHSLRSVYPSLLSEPTVQKALELVATPYRHGGKDEAEKFFLNGMKAAIANLSKLAHPVFPITIFYAFKQAETSSESGTASTGWETFLEATLSAGLSIVGTWPMRTELGNRMLGSGTNALASSIVLVCRSRAKSSPSISRREFVRELSSVLPEALEEMTTGGEHSPVAPVDLSQAIIGPGMAIFSKYSAVLEADGKPMSVKTALQLINRFFAEDDFDHDTQFCLNWFDGHGWDHGKFGEADVLARAKGTSVEGLREGGVVDSSAGRLRLLRFNDLPENWNPETDTRISVWELLHHMIRRLNSEGESGAGEILSKTSRYSENIRTLAYRLYTLCERKGWAQDAGQYNSLVLAWDAIENSARTSGYGGSQFSLFGEDHTEQLTIKEPKKKTRKKT
ncbi:MAG TPA: DUF1156 domain-containing protein [Bacteriovoracaceae bacterium]|nr:DUF1156 domain-containing protein [Bacteriovoracaceae bacterium]